MKRTKLPLNKPNKFPNGYVIPKKTLEIAENIAYKLAWSFNATTRLEIEELISEAKLAAMEGLLAYDIKKKSRLSTYIYVRITNHLILFVKYQKRYFCLDPEIYDLNNIQTNPIAFFEIKDALTPDCKFITELILTNTEKFKGLVPKAARGEVVKLLRQQGWSWPRIWENMRKMKTALNKIPENCIIY